MSLPAADVTPRGGRSPLRPLSFAVLFLVAAIAVAGFVVTRQVVRDQEHRLLKQRNDEAGLYLSSAINGIGGAMSSIAGGARLSNENPTLFRMTAAPLTAKGKSHLFDSIALFKTSPAPAVVAAAGAPLTGPDTARADAARQAEAAERTPQGAGGALVSTALFDGSSTSKRIGFAYASPLLPGYVVYGESEVHPQTPTPATAGAPFSELAVAIYAGSKVQADQLILVSAGLGRLPITGTKATTRVTIGQGPPWLMVAKARHPLVGSVATATPWALLAAGLLAALLATAVVETLSRRREYALAVADARTKELKQSLEDLATAHEQLVRQERLAAIGELASTIGHELRNPLGVISNALYLLRTDIAKAPSEPASRHLATAEREVSAATVIVSDLLEFARQRDPVMTDVDTVALVDEVLGVLPPPTGVTVDRRPTSGPVVALADRDMLRQVLLNVVGNGYQAMPEGGTLTVSVSEDAAGALMRIADSGVGMNDDVRRKLFEPFFTTKARGVGLGLAVCKRIIDAHGGTISVDSQPGAGSTFTVRIPQVRVPRQSSPSEEQGSEPEREPATHPLGATQ